MAKIKEYYYDEVTSKSFEELLNLARWMNSQHSHYPLIVGGWAVWCYTKGLGSRDVDVVFPSRESKHRVIVDFLMSHGYEKVGNILEKRFIKRLMTGNREEEIIIDACSYEDEVAVTGTGIRIPWKYAGKHSRKYEIEKGVFIRIPEVETLLTYKIAAVLGRSNQLRTTLEPEYVQAKVWKDIYDVVSLMKKCKTDKEKLTGFLKETGVHEKLEQIIGIIAGEKDTLQDLEIEADYLRKTLV